jgi:hypothetical protein
LLFGNLKESAIVVISDKEVFGRQPQGFSADAFMQ